MTPNFFPSPQKSPILDFDEHELATLIYGTFPPVVAELARDFVLAVKISGLQFMELDDAKLHILANGNLNALRALQNLRQSPPECIMALMSSIKPSPEIPPDFRSTYPFMGATGFVGGDFEGWDADINDHPDTSSIDLPEWDDYETFGLSDDHQPGLIELPKLPRSSSWSDEEPPARDKLCNPSETPNSSGASKSPASFSPELIVTCQPISSSVISANKTSSMSRNTSAGVSFIKDEISTDSQIDSHRVHIRHLNSDVGRSEEDGHISDVANADLVLQSPSLVNATFNFREINNMISTIIATPTINSLTNPTDNAEDIEEHPLAHISTETDQNNSSDNISIGRNLKTTSPTRRGSRSTCSGTTSCLLDRGHSPNLRSLITDHEHPSIIPQILSFSNAVSTYGPDVDKDSDPGILKEMSPPSTDYRDCALIVNLNLQAVRSHSPNFAPHSVEFDHDLCKTIISGTIPLPSLSPSVPKHSGFSAQSAPDAPLFENTLLDDALTFRRWEAEMPIKLPVHNHSLTHSSSEEQVSALTLTLASSGLLSTSDDDQRSHGSPPFCNSHRSSIKKSPLISSYRSLEDSADIIDQTSSSVSARRSANSFLAHPHPKDTRAESLSEQEHFVMTDTSASSARRVIIHPGEILLMTPASRPASSSCSTVPSVCELGNFVCGHTSRGYIPESHQPSMFLPADNSGYLVADIDSHMHGSPSASTAKNTLSLNQDTCTILEALGSSGGVKQAHYSQTQVDVGIVPELRLATTTVHGLPEHVEKIEASHININPAADWMAHDDAQCSKIADLNEFFLPLISSSPSFSQQISSSLEFLSFDRSANLRETTADATTTATPMPKPPRSACRAIRAMPRTLWPIPDDLPDKSRIAAMSYGQRRPMKRNMHSLSGSSLVNAMAGKAKNATALTYCDAATQTELQCQRKLLKIQADDQWRDLSINPSPSFLGGVHKIITCILPKATPKETPNDPPGTNRRPRVEFTAEGLLPSSQEPISALSKVSEH